MASASREAFSCVVFKVDSSEPPLSMSLLLLLSLLVALQHAVGKFDGLVDGAWW